MTEVEQQVAEILKTFGSRERFVGVVDRNEGTTLWIRSGNRVFFAFTHEALGFQPGALVSFRKDGTWRARDIVKIGELNGKT